MPSRCCIQYVSESGRPSSGHWKDWKRLILIPVPKKGSTKECANHQTSALISYASKVMFKILHARPQHYANQELTDVQVGLIQGRVSHVRLFATPWTPGSSVHGIF